MLDLKFSVRRGTTVIAADVLIPAGVTALFGRSGAGKSTVIHAVAGLLGPERGRIELDGETLFDSEAGVDVKPEHRRLGVVFQDGRLFPHRTVKGNLRYGSQSDDRFDDIVDLLDLAPLLSRRPGSLSGGERQRVAIGRALMTSPRLLLMDEPLASLDVARKAEVLPYMGRLTRELDLPMLYVTHAVEEILDLADSLVIMNAGVTVTSGTVEEVTSGNAFRTAAGLHHGGVAVLANVVGDEAGGVLSRLSFGGGELVVPHIDAPAGTEVRVRIRPQDVGLALVRPEQTSFRNILPATVKKVVVRDDGLVDVRLDCGADITASVTPLSRDELGLEPGRRVFAMIKTVSVRR